MTDTVTVFGTGPVIGVAVIQSLELCATARKLEPSGPEMVRLWAAGAAPLTAWEKVSDCGVAVSPDELWVPTANVTGTSVWLLMPPAETTTAIFPE